MRRALALLTVFALGVVSAPLLREARADFTPPVMLSNGSLADSIHFDFTGPVGNPVVVATVCGRAPLQGGGFSDPACREGVLPPGTFRTNVISVRDGVALTFWKGKFPGL